MTIADVHANHNLFAKYPLDDFKRYYRNMQDIADKAKERLQIHSQQMNKHFETWTRAGTKTGQGNYFWDERDAKDFLEKDVKRGKADDMSIKDLRASRPEYMEFSKEVFRKHVYQEKSRQKGGTYWVVKRNRAGQKKHDKDVRALRREFKGYVDDDVNELVEQWNKMG